MAGKQTTLTESEWRVMEVLWRAPSTLMELVRALAESAGWAKSTVTTMVRRMEDKGLIGHEEQGRAKVFRPLLGRADAVTAETESLLHRAYHGSVGLMVSTLVRNSELSQEELAELYSILEQAEGKEAQAT